MLLAVLQWCCSELLQSSVCSFEVCLGFYLVVDPVNAFRLLDIVVSVSKYYLIILSQDLSLLAKGGRMA
jgi:hypothetical protein